jgi:uncharacterized protein YdcH (DUF465 family)
MAKATKQYDTDKETEDNSRDETHLGGRGVPIHGTFVDYDEQRLEDEAKDRERLRTRYVALSDEELGRLDQEKIKLKDEHETQVRELRAEYRKAKAEIDCKIAEGSPPPGAVSTGLLSNETEEDGSRRYRAPT